MRILLLVTVLAMGGCTAAEVAPGAIRTHYSPDANMNLVSDTPYYLPHGQGIILRTGDGTCIALALSSGKSQSLLYYKVKDHLCQN